MGKKPTVGQKPATSSTKPATSRQRRITATAVTKKKPNQKANPLLWIALIMAGILLGCILTMGVITLVKILQALPQHAYLPELPAVSEEEQQPSIQMPTPVAPSDFANYEIRTVPNEQEPTINGWFKIQDGEIGIVWWNVSVNGTRLVNPDEACANYAGAILLPGNYYLESPGRIRIWQIPADWNDELVKWWTKKVQEEAGQTCRYFWFWYNN